MVGFELINERNFIGSVPVQTAFLEIKPLRFNTLRVFSFIGWINGGTNWYKITTFIPMGSLFLTHKIKKKEEKVYPYFTYYNDGKKTRVFTRVVCDIKDWYRKRKFKIINKDFVLTKTFNERKPDWGKLHFGERTLAKDLLAESIMNSVSIDGVLVESLRSKDLFNYLNSRNHSGYPYFWIKKHLK